MFWILVLTIHKSPDNKSEHKKTLNVHFKYLFLRVWKKKSSRWWINNVLSLVFGLPCWFIEENVIWCSGREDRVHFFYLVWDFTCNLPVTDLITITENQQKLFVMKCQLTRWFSRWWWSSLEENSWLLKLMLHIYDWTKQQQLQTWLFMSELSQH